MTEGFERFAGAFPDIKVHRGGDDTWERFRERSLNWVGDWAGAKILFEDMLIGIKTRNFQIQIEERKVEHLRQGLQNIHLPLEKRDLDACLDCRCYSNAAEMIEEQAEAIIIVGKL